MPTFNSSAHKSLGTNYNKHKCGYKTARESSPARPALKAVVKKQREENHALLVMGDFLKKVEKWKYETGGLSSISAKTNHPIFQEIISMGEQALPLILKELQKEPNHWFSALKIITSKDPVPVKDRGNIPKMREAWLRWGKKQGYLE